MANLNPKSGTLTSLNTTAQQLSTNQPASNVIIENDPNSTVNIGVGDSSHQYLILKPAIFVTIPCANLNQIYVSAVSNTTNTNCNFLSYQN